MNGKTERKKLDFHNLFWYSPLLGLPLSCVRSQFSAFGVTKAVLNRRAPPSYQVGFVVKVTKGKCCIGHATPIVIN